MKEFYKKINSNVFFQKKPYKHLSIDELKSTKLSKKKKLSAPKVYKNLKPDPSLFHKDQEEVVDLPEKSENKLLTDRDYNDLEI